MVITISRETGSGGHTIGKMLAEHLGYKFYDKEIIAEVARKTGLDTSIINENSENMSDQTFIDISSGFVPFSRKRRVPFEEIKAVQDRLLRSIADKGSCVIVGRGGDYILGDRPDAFHIFIHADMDFRIARIQKHMGITGEEKRIRRELDVKDRSRCMFYKYFSGRDWGMVRNYNLCVDTGIFTKEQTVDIILDALKKFQEGMNNA